MSTQTQPALLEARPARVFCANGHVLAEVGTYVYNNSSAFRIVCRACKNDSDYRGTKRDRRARQSLEARVPMLRAMLRPVKLAPQGKASDSEQEARDLARWKRREINGEAWLARAPNQRNVFIRALFDREALIRRDRAKLASGIKSARDRRRS